MAEHLNGNAQSRMIELPGGQFHYLGWGIERRDWPALVLLHGITSSAASWVRVGPALADRYRVYALDMRGHGESSKPPAGQYRLQDTADDALAFIEALKLTRPVLLGHSWGGATALVLASGGTTGGRVPALNKIILEDPACDFRQANAADYTSDIGRPADELRPELIAENPEWSEEDIEGKIDALGQVSREAVVSVFEQARQEGSILPLLAKLPAPTLLMRADPDGGTTLPGKAWDEARAYLPAHSRAIQIDGSTHNIHRTKFDAFMRAVSDFLQA